MFEIESTWIYGKNKQYQTIYDSAKDGRVPIVSGITINNGVNYYTEDILNDDELFSDCLTISTRGEYSGTVTYHEGKFGLANNILTMPMPNWTKNQKLFIGAIINSLSYGGYSGYPRKETLKNDKISLPITQEGEIDFEFMEDFVRELEEERVRELEEERVRELAAYLKASGLASYELSREEREALETFSNLKWEEYKIGDLFEKLNLKFKKSKFEKDSDVSKTQTEEFSLPLINAKDGDNGVMYYGRERDFENTEMTIDIVNDGAVSTGNVYPQPQKTGVLYNAYLIKPKFKANKEKIFFFSTTIFKSIKTKFGYEFKASWGRVSKEFISLPTKNGKPDFDFMEVFTRAVEKLAIKDVAIYADEKISATKRVIQI